MNKGQKIIQFGRDIWSLTSFKIVLILLALLAVYWNCIYSDVLDSLYKNIFAGVIAGLILAFFQVFVDFDTLNLNRVIRSSKLKNVLSNRNDDRYYKELLASAVNEVNIMGVTAERFFRDFGSADNNDRKLIDELLGNGVKFRLLLTAKEGSQYARAGDYRDKYTKNDNFQIVFFDKENYIPQSIFIVDEQCILGPMFSEQDSKDTAALHFYEKNSAFSKQYVDYFEKIWEKENQT